MILFAGFYIKSKSLKLKESKLEKYTLKKEEQLDKISILTKDEEAAGKRRFEYLLEGLDGDSEYEVAVAAINVNGTGPYSLWTSGRTLDKDLPGTLRKGHLEML